MVDAKARFFAINYLNLQCIFWLLASCLMHQEALMQAAVDAVSGVVTPKQRLLLWKTPIQLVIHCNQTTALAFIPCDQSILNIIICQAEIRFNGQIELLKSIKGSHIIKAKTK